MRFCSDYVCDNYSICNFNSVLFVMIITVPSVLQNLWKKNMDDAILIPEFYDNLATSLDPCHSKQVNLGMFWGNIFFETPEVGIIGIFELQFGCFEKNCNRNLHRSDLSQHMQLNPTEALYLNVFELCNHVLH